MRVCVDTIPIINTSKTRRIYTVLRVCIDTIEIMNTSNTTTTKRRKTQLKVASFIQLNEQIIAKYSSFNALKIQRTLFCRGRLEEHRGANNNYKNYMKRKKFIENNFQVAQAPLSESGSDNRIDATNISVVLEAENSGVNHGLSRRQQNQEDADNGEDADDTSNNSEPVLNNDILSDESLCLLASDRKLREEDTQNLCCPNCHRRQRSDLIECYGQIYRMDFYRYVIIIEQFFYIYFALFTHISC